MDKTGEKYQKVITALKRRKKGASAADICAATALPLNEVRDLLPKAADEFYGHLQVTASGEILYIFPNGFTSRYRGFKAALKRFFGKASVVFKKMTVFLFKIWIMVMLIGYFVLFILIALAGIFLSAASKSSNRDSGGVSINLFGLLWRLWFFSELTRPQYPYQAKPKEKRPMHKAIFSFIFGDDDPNSGFDDRRNKAIIAYIQANKGVICLAEFMAFTGYDSVKAQEELISFCCRYSGSPEVTQEGTIVYRFDDLLLRADTKKEKELLPPVKRLKIFSENKKGMNIGFTLINAVNLLFGSYFLYNSVNTGLIYDIERQAPSYLYGITHFITEIFTANPHIFIGVALGIIPFVFSLLFWLIPAIRFFKEKKENEEIKLENFKKIGFGKIWASPLNIDIKNIKPQIPECSPKNPQAADRVIKDMGAVSSVDVKQDENANLLYSFNELEKEKEALNKYRQSVDTQKTELGETVFDSSKELTP